MFQYSNLIYHESRLADYRYPLGARPAGSTVCLRLFAGGVSLLGVSVVLNGGGCHDEIQARHHDGWWEAEVELPDRPMVLWYYFKIGVEGKTFYYGCRPGHTAGRGELFSNQPLSYQLTVYDRDFKTPDFYKKAVMYQIFPDRYAQGNSANARRGIDYHRAMGRTVYLHGSFDETPFYLPMPGEEFYTPNDFFGGDLAGIEQSLTYLADMGVSVIYLNPIFEADSNHRYNTSDYNRIDPVLGDEEAFISLCRTAKKLGIRIILDGVFSHTGSDSVYFNKKGNYKTKGAYQGEDSPYYSWYEFDEFPDSYKCWWGFDTLPEVREHDESWREFVIEGENSVIRKWLQRGASGYRLDVADELPDDTIESIRRAVKQEDGEKLLLGEVWEDATTKQSYGKNRTYALGKGLDSVMNYPFRNAAVDFLLGRLDAREMVDFLSSQMSNYPLEMYYCLMNLLSSHDIERIKTALAIDVDIENMTREQQGTFVVLPDQARDGEKRERLAAIMQFVLPGMPSIYYGDETGMDGLRDPFNRKPFHIHDQTLVYFYRSLSRIRRNTDVLSVGRCSFAFYGENVVGIFRYILDGRDAFGNPAENGAYLCLINRSDSDLDFVVDFAGIRLCMEKEQHDLLCSYGFSQGICLLTGKKIEIKNELAHVDIFKNSGMIFNLSKA